MPNFAKYLCCSPDTATVEDLRRYHLHLADHGITLESLNAAISGLKFFVDVTLDRGEAIVRVHVGSRQTII